MSATVQLDGAASQNNTLFFWQDAMPQDLPSAMLDDPLSPTPSFVADTKGYYMLQLTVFNADMVQSTDWVVITLGNPVPALHPGDSPPPIF